MATVGSPTRIFAAALSLVFGAQLGISISLPSLPTIARELDMTAHAAEMSISLYVIGISASLPLWGAASDRWGRRRVLAAALLLFAVASLAIAFAENPETFLCLRLVEGIGAGGCAISGRIVVRDNWQDAEFARRVAYLSLSYVVALGGGQFLGARMETLGLWRFEFALLSLLPLVAALALRGVPLAAGRPGGRLAEAFAAYPALLRMPAFLAPAMAGGLGYAALLSLQQAGPFLLVERFGEPATRVGDAGLAAALAYFAGSLVVGRLVVRTGQHAMLLAGSACVLAVGLAGVLPGLSGPGNALAFISLLAGISFAQAILFPPSFSLAANVPGDHGAQATAFAGFLQQTFAALAAAAVALLPNDGILVPATAAAGFGALALLLAARR